MAAPVCLFWTIWRGRNKAVFEDVEVTAQGLRQSFAYALWSWAKAFIVFESCSVNDFPLSLGAV